MIEKLTNEDVDSILGVLAEATIKGNQATAMAILMQKVHNLKTPEEVTPDVKKK